jgi:predicted RNA-binding protein with PUA-like domain
MPAGIEVRPELADADGNRSGDDRHRRGVAGGGLALVGGGEMIVLHRFAATGDSEGQEQEGMAHVRNLVQPAEKIYQSRMAYWLMKSEPGSYAWDDLVRDRGTEWDGVRNAAARLHLRAMRPGDEALLYHSGADKAAVGIMRIAREGAPDPKDGDWVSVRVEPVRALAAPVTLAAIKAEPRLAKLEMLRQSRLSVSPVRDEEWSAILEMAGA